jgi:hypothetical protein
MPRGFVLFQVGYRHPSFGSGDDDTSVSTASRWVGAFGAVVCLAAAVVMCVAAFLPYTGGNWGDALNGPVQVTLSIVSGSAAWLVLGTIVALGLVAAVHLSGFRRHATGFIGLAASLLSLGLAFKLPSTWKLDGVVYGEPYLLYVGYYVFLRGAVAAVVGALLMVIAGFVGSPAKTAAPMHPSPS